jgi:hypothetical protein
MIYMDDEKYISTKITKMTVYSLTLAHAVANIEIANIELEREFITKPLRASAAQPRSIWSAPDSASVWNLRSNHTGRALSIRIRMPRALTFGARHTVTSDVGRKRYGMVFKYDMGQCSQTLDPLRELHERIKAHLVKPSVFTLVMPETTRAICHQINLKYKTGSDDLKRRLFFERSAAKVESLFGADSAFKLYTDYNTIVLGSIDVADGLVTEDFLRGFGARGSKPYVCLVDAVVVLHAIVISPDESHMSMDMRCEHIAHGPNISYYY